MKNKYQEALTNLILTARKMEDIRVMQELVDKEIPMKPKVVKLFGDDVPTCPAKDCGVGLVEEETIWHKSTYCGKCGQRIDWSEK